MIVQTVGVFLQQPFQTVNLVCHSFILQAQYDNPVVMRAFPKHLRAKILVVGNQNPIFCKSLMQNGIIISPAGLIIYRKHFMPMLEQPASNRWTGTFIYQKAQLVQLHTQGHKCGIFQGFGGKQ